MTLRIPGDKLAPAVMASTRCEGGVVTTESGLGLGTAQRLDKPVPAGWGGGGASVETSPGDPGMQL